MGSRQPARSGAGGGSGSEWSVEVIGFSRRPVNQGMTLRECGVLLGFLSQMNESHRLYPKRQSTSHRSGFAGGPKENWAKK